MSDALQKTTAEPDIVIDIRGDVSGQVAVGENIYQHQTNVSDGGLAYVLSEDVVPFTKAQRPVRLLSRADPPLIDREEEMAEVIGNQPPTEAAKKLIERAKEEGGTDNITIVIAARKES